MGADLPNSARRREISSPCMLSISLLVTMATERSWRAAGAAAEGMSASAVLAAAAAAAAAAGSMVCWNVVLCVCVGAGYCSVDELLLRVALVLLVPQHVAMLCLPTHSVLMLLLCGPACREKSNAETAVRSG